MTEKMNLAPYMLEGIKMEWLEAFEESVGKHIAAVQEAGDRLGVRVAQLAMHDNSKYSLEEFPYYAQQFHGDKSNPDGFARAWLHHIHYGGEHHWQHWIFPDNYTLNGSSLEEGGVMEMPEHYALEMISDWMGASYVYTGSWDMHDWLMKNRYKIILHSETTEYVRSILDSLGYEGIFKSIGDR